MEWITKLIKCLKVPLGVLLPAMCIFSGILLFASDELLTKMNLLEWSNENGFIFGLLFLISLSFILVYIIIFVKNKASNLWFKLILDRKTIKGITQLNESELYILAKLYNSPAYTSSFDFNHPVIKGLLARNIIYTGGEQFVEIDVFTNTMPIKVTLQPYVLNALNKYLPIIKEQIHDYYLKLKKAKTEKQKKEIQETIEWAQYFCDLFEGKRF